MNTKILSVVLAMVLFLSPNVNYGQAPTLGTAANFVLFSSAGAVTNSGIPHLTHLTGNVGTNSGSSTGFGNVDGVMHDGDGASGTCAADLLTAYGQLNSAIPTFFPAPLLGNGDTLVAGVYHIPSAATMNLNLILDAKGDPGAVFIFQIQGAFSTNAASKVILINGAVACNVFWKVEGLVSMATGTTMRGTIVAHNAAINMSADDTLEGRALSIAGAVTTNALLGYTPIGCGSSVLTGPAAPALVSTAAYGVFSSIGPVTNTGITNVIGDVGTNSGLTTGFNPLLVTGMIHPSPDGSTAACAADLTNVYNYLNTLPADIELLFPAQFGNDLVLTPHTYIMKAATTFTNTIYLNAEGNTNAVFVIQINGALTTSTLSKVILTNGAQAKNVYWKVDGAVHIFDNSVFNGTIVAAGAVTLNTGDTLSGRALTTNGAVNINGSDIVKTVDTGCIAPLIGGTRAMCPGSTTTLTNADTTGMWSSNNTAVATISSTSGMTSGITTGTATITYTTASGCISTAAVTVNPSPSAITGPGNVCVGSSITLSDTTAGGIWSSSNTSLASVGTGSGIVTGTGTGRPVISYAIPGGCAATKTIVTGAYAGVITGPASVCTSSSIILTDSVTGGTWSASNTMAAVTAGIVTGVSAGTDTIMYTVTNLCGTITTSTTVRVDTTPTAGSITGASTVCAGAAITLTDIATGGTWRSSNAVARVTGGVVTGVSAGSAVISYTVTNSCSTISATKNITVNPLPDEGSIAGPADVCTGSTVTLTESVTGGVWSSSNTTASVSGGIVTGTTAGTDTIRYAVTNSCKTATAIQVITIAPTFIPAVSFMAIPGGAVCNGTAVTFTATPANGGPAPVYAWKVNGVLAGATTNTFTKAPANGDIITSTLYSSLVCTTPDSATDSLVMAVTPTVTPSIIVSATPGDTICMGTLVTYTSSSVNGGTLPSYLWTVNGINVSTAPDFIYTPANTDVIHCVLTSNAICPVDTTAGSNTIVMTVNSGFIPIVTINIPGGIYMNVGAADTFIAVVTDGGSAPAYKWFVNATAATGPTATTAEFITGTLHNDDSVSCQVTGSGPCGYVSFSSVTVKVKSTGVPSVGSPSDIRLIPNPNNGAFVINGTLGSTTDEEASVEVTDMLGQIVYRNKIVAGNGNINERVQLSSTLTNGMYILTIRTATANKVFHFVLNQ